MEARIESLAAKLLRSGEHDLSDMEAARRAARRMLEESEERTSDPAVHDHEADGVIRRSSGETAATGETHGTRRVSDGD